MKKDLTKKQKSKWRELSYNMMGGNNSILKGRGFYISYNANPGGMIMSFRSDTGGAETALCKDGKFYILNGDFRKQYEKLITIGFKACKDFYESEKYKYGSSWSNED